jgi:hypothetical protein
MRRVIIDNSTITASQRLLGSVKVNNKYLIDGDILAFENLIQAILYYDKIIVLDDYKKEFSKTRKEVFPFIDFIEPEKSNYQSIIKQSDKAFQDDLLL